MMEAELDQLETLMFRRLEKDLHPGLTYHNLFHTKDVIKQAGRIASEEGITDPAQLILLRLAALYHDSGFIDTYQGHESRSCEIMLHELTHTGLSEQELDQIRGMIMATRIPQLPMNQLESIICDADLDYIGRDDFPEISQRLMKELLNYKKINSEKEWDPIQIEFFENHNYFTNSSRCLRQPKKMEHLYMLKEKQAKRNLNNNNSGI